MATIVLSAVGTLIGGPIGGSIGALIGSQIDASLFGPSDREGPRLKELALTTSSYGTAIPRHFGTMRVGGSVIWATDLVEMRERSGGGKGRPGTTTFSYSSNFAVALSSRPVASLGRVWADGNLLRGAAGDLKTGGTLRFYKGHGDQQPDPLIAAAEGASCPAFRGLSYVVFEDLQLADFGNRLPSLTFELHAENGDVQLVDVVAKADWDIAVDRDLPALTGFSDEGGALGNVLATIALAYPLASDAGANGLRLFSPDAVGASVPALPAAVIDPSEESFGGQNGISSNRNTSANRIPSGIRYYDTSRDYQAGLQLAGGRAVAGQTRIIEFPGALSANNARELAEQAAKRARSTQDRISYRIAEVDPALTPGKIVTVPNRSGAWRIESWEWREFGVELALARLPASATPAFATEAGRSLAAQDALITPTLLAAFELPWDGTGANDRRQIFAAPSSTGAGWSGAILYAEHNGGLETLGGSGNRRSISGTITTDLSPASCAIASRETTLDIQLHSAAFALDTRTMEDLARGANRALIGEEVVQFASATPLGNGRWRLAGLLRGRGGTEHLARSGSPVGARFVLLDDRPVGLDADIVGTSATIAAIGIADETPAIAQISGLQSTLRPLAPVHPRALARDDGSLLLCWTRRARGAYRWEGTVEPPLIEQTELYEVGYGNPRLPLVVWQVTQPEFALSPTDLAQLSDSNGPGQLWVRQIGTHARSLPTLLTTLN